MYVYLSYNKLRAYMFKKPPLPNCEGGFLVFLMLK
nr:MAG TPA: hypothetical protein [Caudoviricetes sp.]